jgi:hypothetical protein
MLHFSVNNLWLLFVGQAVPHEVAITTDSCFCGPGHATFIKSTTYGCLLLAGGKK